MYLKTNAVKILYHHRTRSGDAQGIHIYEMVKAFRDLGHSVEIAALVKSATPNEENAQRRAWSRLTGWVPSWLYELMSLVYNVYGYWHLSKVIRKEHPDLIYERYSLNTFCGIWASWRFRVPIVLEVNLPLYYELSRFGKLSFKKFARFSERWISSHSTWTIVVSAEMKRYLIREGVPAEKLIVMTNGIDPKSFHPAISGTVVRERFNVTENTIVVGFVGWFREWHGLEALLKLMHEAELAKRGVRLLLVGNGPAYDKLRRFAEEHDLLSAVIFAGAVARSEVPSFIAAMDIAVLPKTNDYGCPMKVIEYMAMGKCIVAPDQPVIRELLEDKVSAYLFTPDDSEALKRVLLEAIYDPSSRAFFGARAHDVARGRNFLWSRNAADTLKLVFGARSERSVETPRANSSAMELP